MIFVVLRAPDCGRELRCYSLKRKKDLYIIAPDPPLSRLPEIPGLAKKDENIILCQRPDICYLRYIPIDIAGGNVYELAFFLDFTFRSTDLF